MKLAILSRESKNYSTQRLIAAAKSRGHSVKILNTLKFVLDLEEESPNLYFKQKKLSHYDAILPRIGSSITYFGSAVVRQFQQMDVYSPNSADGILNSRDKLRSFQILSKYKIGIPATTFVKDKKSVLSAIQRVGGAPVVIKLLEGTQGIGVLLAHTLESATSIIEFLQSQKQNILIQKFVAESKGRDIRAIVVGDQVVAAMRRVAQGQEFRSNVHRGGKTELVELDDTYEKTAVRAAKIMDLGIAGVDMLEGKDGPQIMEINSSPGLEGIESCTKLDIAGAFIDYIHTKVNTPEKDLQERLTNNRGYGITEIVIPSDSKYIGQTIAHSDFYGKNINTLALSRKEKLFPNPNTDKVLEAGDRILCFGKMESIQDIIPEKSTNSGKQQLKKLTQEDIQKAQINEKED